MQRYELLGAETTKHTKAECMHALNGLALPRASRSGEIALAASRRPRSMLAAAPVLVAHAGVTVAETL